MKKTAGDIMAELHELRTRGASAEEILKKKQEFEKESKKQLHGAKVTVAVEIRQ